MGNTLNVNECVCGKDERGKHAPLGSLKTRHGQMSTTSLRTLEFRPFGEFVMLLQKATNVPKMDWKSESDCYVDMHFESDTTFVTPLFRSMVRHDTEKPVWNSYVRFPIRPKDTDKLVLRLYDSDTFALDDLIGTATILVSELRKHVVGSKSVGAFPLVMDTTNAKPNPKKPTLVYLSVLGQRINTQIDEPFGEVKDFFLIRHGESVWNEGKHNMNVIKLASDYDHPLNSAGVQQAMQLQQQWTKTCIQKESNALNATHHQTFMNAERVIASPMTRATQTALIALREHPALASKPLLMFRNLREKKGSVGSLDCVGIRVGEDIRGRVENELRRVVKSANATLTSEDVASAMKTNINFNDCCSGWWTSSTSDSEQMMRTRYFEMWKFLKYSIGKSMILVGHSNFFLQMMRDYLDETSFTTGERAIFAEKLKQKKLDNAACLHIKVQFPKMTAAKMTSGKWLSPKIIDANFLFGTQFKGEK